jgi:hypothetical protein
VELNTTCVYTYYIILYFIVLYYILFYFIVLYYIILYFIVLYYILFYCTVLYYIIFFCIILYHIVLFYILLRHIRSVLFIVLADYHTCVYIYIITNISGWNTCQFACSRGMRKAETSHILRIRERLSCKL